MPTAAIQAAPILIVDDEEVNVRLLRRLLHRAGYTAVHSTTDSRQSVRLLDEVRPDLILLDLHMPKMDGFAVMAELQPRIGRGYLPILVLTADLSPDAKQRALSSGARDFVAKPFDIAEVLLRVNNLLETRLLHVELQQEKTLLEERVRERTRALEETQLDVLRRLAQAAEFRDDDTGQHTQRVGAISAHVAAELGLPEPLVELIWFAAPLHDVGKIGIPDAVLLKPGRLTPEEFAAMKEHARIGAELLAGGGSDAIRLAEQIALAHHERWDGTGYPRGLAGAAIPIAARIVALADFYDALSHDRPYRPAWPEEEIMAEIDRQTGHHFDPAVVRAFVRVRHEIELRPPTP